MEAIKMEIVLLEVVLYVVRLCIGYGYILQDKYGLSKNKTRLLSGFWIYLELLGVCSGGPTLYRKKQNIPSISTS